MKPDFKLYTMEEAKEKGIPFAQQDPKTCEYCGRQLEQLGTIASDGFVRWLFAKECDCEGKMAEIARIQAEEDRAREEAAKKRAIERCRSAGIGKLYLNAEISEPACIRYVNGFADANGKGLYLLGGVGAGKTHEACALAKAFLFSGYSVKVTTTLAMLNSIHSTYDGAKNDDVMAFCRADVLFLDDLGKENANSWAMTTLFEVINYRYENMLPTIFTSQYGLDSLERRLSRSSEVESAKAIVSRIAQMSQIVMLKHTDRRRQKN